MFASFGTSSTNLSAHWHPEPRGRGTFNILSTCLTTMILCVWTAIHLNIPDHHGDTLQKFLRKPGWLLLALLAPEFVAWNAWEQRRTARELTNAFIEALGPGQPSPPIWFRRAWNSTARYFTGSKVYVSAYIGRPGSHSVLDRGLVDIPSSGLQPMYTSDLP
jgi:hypothetical protein